MAAQPELDVEKVIYLVWKPESVAIETFRDALLGPVAEQAFAAGAHRLVVSAADLAREIPKPTLLMGEGKTLSASFDVWLDCIDDRRPIESERCACARGARATATS
jgi:hypothetical protein